MKDNTHKYYSATIYREIGGLEKAATISALFAGDIVIALFSFGILAFLGPDENLDDLKLDISKLKKRLAEVKRERNKYKEQKKEIKALAKTI